MKLTIVGAGSSYTPELIEEMILRRDTLPVKELVLYDINENISKSGYTSSKLKFIHLDNYLTDDVGNIIEGIYDVSGHTNHQPAEGTVLEPLYQIGVISNVTNVDGHDDMFKGDVIDTVDFYYKLIDFFIYLI